MRKRCVVPLAIVVGLVLLPGLATAALIWDSDPNDFVVTEGPGAWQSGGGDNWFDPDLLENNNVPWDNSNPNVAQFGESQDTTGYAVTVDPTNGVTATGLTFLRPYTLGESTTASTITLAGTAPVISIPSYTANIQPTIYSALATSASTLEINGFVTEDGKYSLLTLSGANSYTGTLKLTGGGFVYIANTAGLPTDSAGVIVDTNCTLSAYAAGTFNAPDVHISGYGVGQTADNLSANRGAIRFHQSEDATMEWNGNIILDEDAVISTYSARSVTTFNGVISGDHMMIKTGLPELILTKPNTYTGGTRMYRGMLTLNSTTGYAILGNVDFRNSYTTDGTADKTKRLAVLHGDDDGMPQLQPTAVVYFDPEVPAQYLDLRGHTLTLGGISNFSSVPTTTNKASAIQNNLTDTAGTLIVNNASDFSYRGIIRDSAGTLALIKRGTGTLTLDGQAHRFSGGLTVEQGTVVYGVNTESTSHYSPSLVVKSGATLNVSAKAGFSINNAYTPADPANPGTKLQQVLKGNGTVVGDLLVSTGGTIAPGESVGRLTINGALNLATDGNMTWELGALLDNASGTAGVDFDSLVVNGDLSLGGTSKLTLDFTAVGTPDGGNAFWNADRNWTVIDAMAGAIMTDNFASIVNGTFARGTFNTSVVGDDVLLNYVASSASVPGDTDADGDVDAIDAAKLSQYWLQRDLTGGASVGDFNLDGTVNDLDASILAAHWAYGGSTAAVPEPSALVLILLALAGVGAMKRRGRQR